MAPRLVARLHFTRVIRIIRLRFGSPVASAFQAIEAVIETVNDRRSSLQPDVFRGVSIARRLVFISPCRSFVLLVARLVITLIVSVVNERRPLILKLILQSFSQERALKKGWIRCYENPD
ncbi:MAG: hypothetical protein ACRD9Y_08815 [Blastocatellia bacterium]